MRFSFYFTYWSLYCVTIFSSCLLFFVVATENAMYVAAAADAAAAGDDFATAADGEAGAGIATADGLQLNTGAAPHEKILPNYKKLKKLSEGPSEESAGADDAPASISEREFLFASKSLASEVLASTAALSAATNAEALNNIVDDAASISVQEKHEQETEQQALSSVEKTGEAAEESLLVNDLPDITDIPSITSAVPELTELPLEVLEPTRTSIDSLLPNDPKEKSASSERMNKTLELLIKTSNSEEMQQDEQIIKINDSGGDTALPEFTTTATTMPIDTPSPTAADNIPTEPSDANKLQDASTNTSAATTTTTTAPLQEQQQPSVEPLAPVQPTPASAPTKTVPVEEVPIPVFSEWAQKQMEAAEKQQQLEQDVVNTSTQKKNNNINTNGNGKLPPLKLRSKNYASPDCGAKIIASNADASNTGAVLSASKDEYMLSPCTNRIWFVVELCEAIQAQKIDLANFELFSSSPRNFTVAVSNRFPTRDWSNVGRFIAEDARTVQSFDLHPHLFGKFVRVDIHSHYSKEHFCPVSLFRVFGTSEFEAFETENHPNEDLDDFDDEFGLEQAHVKNSDNIFKSASDAVLSIVKKAAEVLVKPASNNNASLTMVQPANVCQTPAYGQFSCAECSNALVERINVALACKTKALNALLSIERLRGDLLDTRICIKHFGIETKPPPKATCGYGGTSLAKQKSYYLHLLPTDYVGALCQLIAERQPNATLPPHLRQNQPERRADDAELALNLTIDKKLTQSNADFERVENVKEQKKKIITTEEAEAERSKLAQQQQQQLEKQQATVPATTMEPNEAPIEQLARPIDIEMPTTTTPITITESNEPTQPDAATKDVNIFNLNVDDTTVAAAPPAAVPMPTTQQESNGVQQPLYEGSADYSHSSITSSETPPTVSTISTEDPSSWDSIDNLLTSSTVAPGVVIAAGGSQQPSGGYVANGMNMQQKIPNGGPHSESIFIRLSNRIKALERNMSLSGQYLEELSRRYKKQVEELQQTLTQQTSNVRTLEEQNRRHSEYEQLLSQRNLQLKDELEDLTLQVHACIVVIIFVGAFVFLVVMVGILFIRSMRRETRELVALQTGGGAKRKTTSTASTTASQARKLHRRKSFEDFSDHQQTLNTTTASEKQRRPSEEAMLILKDCGGDAKDNCEAAAKSFVSADTAGVGDSSQDSKPRRRKISICYNNSSSNNNNNSSSCNMNDGSGAIQKTVPHINRRKGDKHSWPNSEQSQQQARKHLEQLHAMEEYDRFSETDLQERDHVRVKANPLPNGSSSNESTSSGGQPKGKSAKKRSQQIKRQVSAPNSSNRDYVVAHAHSFDDAIIINNNSDYDESLLLDEDDLDNFLPVADLAYNEFMPEGPSGYQISAATATTSALNSISNQKAEKASGKKGARRLSSPAFFKSPFSKSLKLKSATGTTSATPPHESTSWEWYRSKKSDKQAAAAAARATSKQLRTSASDSFYQRSSPAASIDSSSLSEINFPTNSTENSFRILEEAILSSTSGGAATTPSNGNGNGGGGGSSSCGSSSVRSTSTTSSTKKKKNRSFNKIFRKVF